MSENSIKEQKYINFDEIRPYKDAEINLAIHRVIKEPSFLKGMHYLFTPEQAEKHLKELPTLHTHQEFQARFVYFVVEAILSKTTKGITFEGFDKLDPQKNYLFISNHRDIVLDSAFLNYLLLKNGHSTTEIAIGDNLLLMPWIVDFVKLNRSFIVHRNVPVKQMYEESLRLSSYMRHTLIEKKTSIWLAQREGRTKDGNDRTQVGLLKMLMTSSSEKIYDAFKSLQIVPLTISYEYNPNDLMMIKEVHAQELGIEGKNDLTSMATGIIGQKGRVHYSVGKPLADEIDNLQHITNKNDFIKELAQLMDRQIYKGYKFWPVNYLAYDQLTQTSEYASYYSEEEKKAFEVYVTQRAVQVSGYEGLIRKYLLEMYATPVINKRSVEGL